MTYTKSQPFKPQFEDANGNPLVLGTVELYLWNTTTPTPYYTDSIGTSGGTSFSLNSLGKPTNDLFFDSAITYKLVTKDAAGSVIDTLGPFSVSPAAVDFSDTSSTALGDALIGIKRTLSNAVATTLHAWIEGQEIDPKTDFGATADGSTDDTTAINNALSASNSSGLWVDGKNRTFAVTGNISLPASVRLKNIKFKQLSPNNASRRTLYMSTGTLCHLQNISVDRNGNGAGGALNDAAGIYINDCDRVVMEDVEVFGNDKGNGIAVIDSDDIRIDRAYVHDMIYGTSSDSAYTDDQLQGIWIVRGNRAVISMPIVKNLQGRWTAQTAFNRFTRGIAVSGTSNYDIISPTIENVDQGIDLSGSDNPQQFSVMGGQVTNAYSWGYKSANTVTYGKFVGCTAKYCSLGSFVASAPSSTMSPQTQNIDYIGCQAIGTGNNGVWNAGSNVAAFSAYSTGTYPTYPRAIRWIQCQNIGGSNTEYGFYTDVTLGGNGDIWVEQIDCTSIFATVAHFQGLHEGYVCRNRTTTQSITNNTWTSIEWDNTIDDRMLSGGSTGDEILMRRAGLYDVSANAGFAANGTGIRGMRVLKNGILVPPSSREINGYAGGIVHVGTTIPVRVAAGDIIKIQVLQDSGGSLNLAAGECAVVVTQRKLGVGT